MQKDYYLCKISDLLLPPTFSESTERKKSEKYLLIYNRNYFSISGRSNLKFGQEDDMSVKKKEGEKEGRDKEKEREKRERER